MTMDANVPAKQCSALNALATDGYRMGRRRSPISRSYVEIDTTSRSRDVLEYMAILIFFSVEIARFATKRTVDRTIKTKEPTDE